MHSIADLDGAIDHYSAKRNSSKSEQCFERRHWRVLFFTPAALTLIWIKPTFKFLAGIYSFKVHNENTRAMCKIFSKLIIKTPERRQWCLCCKLGIDFTNCSGVSIVDLEQVNTDLILYTVQNTCSKFAIKRFNKISINVVLVTFIVDLQLVFGYEMHTLNTPTQYLEITKQIHSTFDRILQRIENTNNWISVLNIELDC